MNYRTFNHLLLLATAGLLATVPATVPAAEDVDVLNAIVVMAYSQGKFKDALPIAEKVVAMRKATAKNKPADYATSLNNLGEVYRGMRMYEKAEPLMLQALEIERKVYGKRHPSLALNLSNLGAFYEEIGALEKAEPYLLEGKAILEASDNEDSTVYSGLLTGLGSLYKKLGIFDKAERFFLKAKEIRRKELGKNDPAYAMSLGQIAGLYEEMGAFQKAEPLMLQASEILRTAWGAENPYFAAQQSDLAQLYIKMGLYSKAEPLLIKAKENTAKNFGRDHLNYGLTLRDLGELYQRMARYADAETLLRRAVGILETKYGREHQNVASSLQALGLVLRSRRMFVEAEDCLSRTVTIQERMLRQAESQSHNAFSFAEEQRQARNLSLALDEYGVLFVDTGRYGEAEKLFRRALEVLKKRFAEDHLVSCASRQNLGHVYLATGRYAEAEQFLRGSLSIAEKGLGPEHPDVAAMVSNLASLYLAMGRYEEAEQLFLRALAISEKQLGPNHPVTAESLCLLGNTQIAMRHYAQAEANLKRALTVCEGHLEPGDRVTALSVGCLAAFYQTTDRISEAIPLMERSLVLSEKAFGPEHQIPAAVLNNLALLHRAINKPAEAKPLHLRALAIVEKQLGPAHPDTAKALLNLAGVCDEMGNGEESRAFALRAIEAFRRHSSAILAYFAEPDLVAFGQSIPVGFLAGNLGDGPITLQTQLWFKGMVAEEMMRRRREASLLSTVAGGPELAATLDDLRNQIHAVSLRQGEKSEFATKLKNQFEEERRKVRALLGNRATQGMTPAGVFLNLETVYRRLAPGQALVECFRYEHAFALNLSGARYVSTLLSPAGEVVRIELGSAKKLEADIAAFRRLAIKLDPEVQTMPASQRDEQMRQVSYRLYRALVTPLLPTLKKWGTRTLLVSPDAQLHFLPWEMLLSQPAAQNQIAATALQFRYLSSGRDLVLEPGGGRSHDGLLVANPTFDFDVPVRLASTTGLKALNVKEALLSGLAQDSQAIRFKPLAGLAQVQRDLPPIFSQHGQTLASLSEKRATEPALIKGLSGQRVVHLATHGLFLNEIKIGQEKTSRFQTMNSGSEEQLRAPVRIQDPMFRSGLALAGAQNTLDQWRKGKVPEPSTDGLLLAAEAVALDLSGTDVLFLGACETAMGDALDGEGVMGLRRALAIAGARHTILTLWPVLDQPTVEFTKTFYEKYLGGLAAPTALAETKKELFNRWLETDGYAEAVRKAGPFVCTSVGKVE